MKKGISPIVSTVLMVAFVIVLIFLVFGWIRGGITDKAMEKTERKITKQLDCSNIEIEVVNACVDDVNNAAKLQLNIDVMGDDPVKDITIRVIGEDGDVETKEYSATAAVSLPGRLLTATTEITLDAAVTNPIEIEVYPKTENGDICKDKVEKIRNIQKC